ncbi:hypothetical protein E3N88_31690 [Mikania micrantha]|uniref:J domain-containing protein n=1 Tax=Mikania micrantha TaxID=192012 RepID=A0A5N6M7G2_9ASTR|nr:hypothetical protein E3N88_31690 [Mikania micrantha]
MDEFGMLAKDFGFRPQGKSAPMKPSGGDRRSRPASSSTTFTADGNDLFHDVFGGPPKYTNSNSKSTSSISDFDYGSIFKDSISASNNETKTKFKSSNLPVFDKPVYDDDMLDVLPGTNSKSEPSSASAGYEDNIFTSVASSLRKQSQRSDQFDDLLGNLGRREKAEPTSHHTDRSSKGLDDLISGFGSSSPASSSRWSSDPSSTSTSNIKEKSNVVDDPFVVLESMPTPDASSQDLFTDPLEQLSIIGKSKSTKSGVTPPSGNVFGDMNSLNSFSKSPPAFSKETRNRKKGPSQTHSEEGSSVGSARSSVSRGPIDEYSFGYPENQPQKMPFDHFHESHQTAHGMTSVYRTSPTSHIGTRSHLGTSPKSEEHVQYADNIWLTVSEILLYTPITRAPPPSRPPPPIPAHASSTRTSDNDFFSSSDSAKYPQNANASRNKEPVHIAMDEVITRERLERDREEEEREQRRLEQEKIREIEREKARQAVERANREARERAATEARLKAERAAVQRAQNEARERAAVEARERAEQAAAEKAAAETKEEEAREKEKAAVAKAQAEARRRAERAAVERVTAEARERAASEARERAAAVAAAAKMNQQKKDNDLDNFFDMSSQPNSGPKARANSNDSTIDPLSQDRRGPEGANRTSGSGIPSSVGRASSTASFADDLSSIFGAGEFQDVEGETEERRRARLERQQRAQERAAKALADKNQRDLQIQKEQEERQRISTTLDVEIKRWAAGKEGNLRAMLSTLQYVLWPECGWQPVSLTDLIIGASVKKVYRKATLCIHPDKVQQKGASLQQKYVAEKVFDLLKMGHGMFRYSSKVLDII